MKIALVGNQNSGKTTLFNLLTGFNQKVGNWPGVTIERKVGIIKDTEYELVDLPGIYSLSPYSAEEELSRQYIFNDRPDLIINIIDATSLERSLYLTTQLLELDTKVIVALNMEDLLNKKGITIDADKLSNELQTTVVRISALKVTGINELVNCIKNDMILPNLHKKIYEPLIEQMISRTIVEVKKQDFKCIHERFVAVKVLEEDQMFNRYLNNSIQEMIKQINKHYETDVEESIASLRYDYILKIKNKCVETVAQGISMTDRLDKIFLNKWAAIPIFVIIMALIYYLSVGAVGGYTVGMMETLIEGLSSWIGGSLENADASTWVISLVCDGIIGGVGAMLAFVPQLIIMFICISILETTGYMSRIAFFLDKLLRKFGLSGKSLIPFIVGSGCSVPGIMTCRTIENEEERKMTIMLTPFIPCSAKLPIIIAFTSFFFVDTTGLIATSLYFLAIIVILICALIMKKFIYKATNSVFISELPEYKVPHLRYIIRNVFEKTWAFIRRAGTVILLCSVVIWLMLTFTWKFEYTDGESFIIDDLSVSEIATNVGIIDFNPEINTPFIQIKDNNIQIAFMIENENGKSVITPWQDILDIAVLEKKIIERNERKSFNVGFNGTDSLEYKYVYGIDQSILAGFGKSLSWVFYPIIGESNWAATVSAIQGLVAKEQVIGSMAVIAGYDDSVDKGTLIFKEDGVFGNFTPLSAYAFMTFNLFSAPCFGAIGAMRRELGSAKKMLKAVGFQTGLAWAISALVFGLGSLIGVFF